jgi:hypothetical protein
MRVIGGVFGRSFICAGGVAEAFPVDVEVPGNPPPPLARLHGLLVAVGRRLLAHSSIENAGIITTALGAGFVFVALGRAPIAAIAFAAAFYRMGKGQSLDLQGPAVLCDRRDRFKRRHAEHQSAGRPD